jgi:hypothetical protein
MVSHDTLSAPTWSGSDRLAVLRSPVLGCGFLLVFIGSALAMFDVREVQRALVLAALGTALIVTLFALLVEAHPPTGEAAGQAVASVDPTSPGRH